MGQNLTSETDSIVPSPWMAWRVFRSASVESTKAVLQSERDHSFAVLEGQAAVIWDLLVSFRSINRLVDHCSFRGWDCGSLKEFLAELIDSGYISEVVGEYVLPETAPTPQRLEFASNTSEEADMMHWAADHGFLWAAQWEMTFRCNERCVHCYNPGAAHAPNERPSRSRDELSLEEAKLLLRELVDIGVFRLILSGGEVTLRKDLLETVRYARDLGFSVSLYTNGLQLHQTLLDALSELYPTSISLSLYSTDPSKHDEVTGVPGSYVRTLDAARRVRSKNIKLYIKCPLMRETADGYASVVQLAESMGAAAEIDLNLSDGADGASIVNAIGIKDARFVLMMALTQGSPLYVGTAESGYGRAAKDPESTVCGAGSGILYIDPEGNISSCSGLPSRDLNIRSRSVAEAWSETPIGVRRSGRSPARDTDVAHWQQKALKTYAECGTHLRCGWCSKCPSMAVLEHGDDNRPSSLNCFHAGSKMLAAKWLSSGVGLTKIASWLGTLPIETCTVSDAGYLVNISGHTRSDAPSGFHTYTAKTTGLDLMSGSAQTVRYLSVLDQIDQLFVA